jgi:16S rRNA G966 N2-methylase RsmD
LILELLDPEVVSFVLKNENADINELLLKHKRFKDIPFSFIADQIRGRQKSKDKLPGYYKNSQVLYPPALNLEQSSSEQTAKFKLDLIGKIFNDKVQPQGADLTGGFGIDACFLSKAFNQYHFIEPSERLISLARHNHQILSAKNIAYEKTSAEEFLKLTTGNYDLIYIDPSRRTTANKKVFTLVDCEPNVVVLQAEIFTKTNCLLVKAAPLLDIQAGLKELKYVKKVIVLSVDNDCKEVLFFCQANFSDEPEIQAINLTSCSESEPLSFFYSEERSVTSEFSEPLKYIYEPNASILKAGAFKLAAKRFGLYKLHPNTHLYTGDKLIENFPGRIFSIISIVKPDPKVVREFFPDGKANVTTRNYPLSTEELKKKTSLKDGGENYLIGFTDIKQKTVAVAKRVMIKEN